MRKRASREFCVVHADGTASDVLLHGPMLDKAKADHACRVQSALTVVRGGVLTREQAERAYDVHLPADLV